MKKFRELLLTCTCLLLATSSSFSQTLDTVGTFSATGYVDAYYAYYTDSVGAGIFQKFPNTSPRSNTPSLNVAQLSFQYNAEKVRATAIFGYGDFMSAVWAPAPYNNIMEAHAGFKVCNKLWADAGLFTGHFGTEWLLPVENIASSITVGTYVEPALESGIKLNYDPTSKLEINLFLLNGYNVFVDNNNKKSFGVAATYTWDNGLGIGYSNYIGDDSPEGFIQPHMRIANNAFLNYGKGKMKIQVGGDFMSQEHTLLPSHDGNATMYSALATFRYQAAKKIGVYARYEQFSDPNGIVSPTFVDVKGVTTGYQLWGITGGIEIKPAENAYIKIESRWIQMQQDQYIFWYNKLAQNQRLEFLVNGGVTFDLIKRALTQKRD